AALGLRNRNAWPQAVIIRLAKWNHDIQTVGRAPLKQYDKLLLARHRRCRHRSLQERRHRAQANHGHAALLQKIPPRKSQSSYAFATFVTHISLSLLRALRFGKSKKTVSLQLPRSSFSCELSAVNCQLPISAETPELPKPTPLRLPNPPSSPDRPASPAPPVDYRAVFRASLR